MPSPGRSVKPNVFICWSGTRGKHLAQLLKKHLPSLPNRNRFRLQADYSDDIAKGVSWPEELQKKLAGCRAGIVCVTPEGLGSRWLHFEAGILQGRLRQAFTYLHGVSPGQLEGPLALLQSTVATKEDTARLLQAILDAEGKRNQRSPRTALDDEAYARWWGSFEAGLRRIPHPKVVDLVPGFERLFLRKTFLEPLPECTSQAWLDRYLGAHDTWSRLKEAAPRIRGNAPAHVADLYDELVMWLDFYAMSLRALLLQERKFDLDDAGIRKIPAGTREACERNRQGALRRKDGLLAPRPAPVLDDSRLYEQIGGIEAEKGRLLAERKTRLIHPVERAIERRLGPLELLHDARAVEDCAQSPWSFDRIVHCLWVEKRLRDPKRAAKAVAQELEKARASHPRPSLVPLHYAVRALAGTLADGNPQPPGVRGLVSAVKAFLDQDKTDKHKGMRENLRRILSPAMRRPSGAGPGKRSRR